MNHNVSKFVSLFIALSKTTSVFKSENKAILNITGIINIILIYPQYGIGKVEPNGANQRPLLVASLMWCDVHAMQNIQPNETLLLKRVFGSVNSIMRIANVITGISELL